MTDQSAHDHTVARKSDPLPSTRDESPPCSAFAGKIVTIEAGTGQDKRTFYAHHHLLTFYSGYFKAALDGGFAESQSGVIKLDTEEPATIEEFVTWLYTSKIRTDEIDQTNFGSHYKSCVKLWIFADCCDIPLLMNEMVDQFQHVVVTALRSPRQVVREVYECTAEESILRRLIVNVYTCVVRKSVKKARRRYYPRDFLIDLVESLVSTKNRPKLCAEEYGQLDLCSSFHAHEEGVRCTRVDKEPVDKEPVTKRCRVLKK